jgi:hypothetical protein
MADNVVVDNGSLTDYTVGTDERTISAVAVQVQRVAPHGAPNMTDGQVTVTNSSTAIIAADSTRHSVIIVNRQTVAVYIGDGTVTTADFRLDPGDSIALFTSAVVNGITAAAYSASGDAKVHYIATHD